MEERRKVTTTHLYNRILECEERLDRLHFDLSSSIRSGDHNRIQWMECRYLLRLLHEELFSTDVEFVVKSQLLAPLWGRLYYGPVEQARAEVSGDGDKDREKIGLEILGLIDEGIGFFMILCYKLQNSIKNEMPLFIRTLSKRRAVPVELVNSLIYECLVFMGDLARYQGVFTFDKPVDLAFATGQYERAAKLIPGNGHAFNQLAVLFCMNDDFLRGMTFYLRATMSMVPFTKSADNLLTVCRRVVNIPEERLALAKDPVTAALFGLLVRLNSAIIVHETTRNTQSVHLESITSGLTRLLSRPQWYLNLDNDEVKVLDCIFISSILSLEFLQKYIDDDRPRCLSTGQLRLFNWIVCCGSKFLKVVIENPKEAVFFGSTISIICRWLLETDAIKRITNTDSQPPTFEENWTGFLRLLATAYTLADDGITLDHPVLDGTQPFKNSLRTTLSNLIRSTLKYLADERILMFDSARELYYLQDESDKVLRNDLFGPQLAKQWTADEVLQLQNYIPKEPSTDSTWHLVDAEALLKYWNQIESRLETGTFRLIITLSVLRYLDFAKSDPTRMMTARQIMRSIASYSKKVNSPVHLQHPSESNDALIKEANGLAKHHVALLSALWFYKTSRGLKPLVVMSEDVILNQVLDKMDIDHISQFSEYFKEK